VTMARRREPERLQPHLPEIRCPVRLLVGMAPHDGGIRAGEITALAEAIPAFTVDSIPGVGHFIQEERPEVVVAAVARMRTP